MTGPSSTQIVSVSLALAGEQTGRIDTNHAGTPQARLHILWGALMLTLTSPTQTAGLSSSVHGLGVTRGPGESRRRRGRSGRRRAPGGSSSGLGRSLLWGRRPRPGGWPR